MGDQPASLAAALVQLQGRLPAIAKTDAAQVGTRVTKYANLHTITEAVFPLLTALGLAWICRPTLAIDKFVLHYQLLHAESGESIDGDYPLPSGTPQTMGGAITYARRYALCAVLGIAPAEDDDDAETASREAAERQQMRTRHIAEERAITDITQDRSTPAARHRVKDDGPLPADEWRIDPHTRGMSDPQRKKIMALFGERGIKTSEDRHAYITRKLDDAPADTGKLSMRQAGELIAHLEAERQD